MSTETSEFNFTRYYQSVDEDGSYPTFSDEEYDFFFRASELLQQPGKTVLDMGCGVGHVSKRIKKLGHRVIGVDPAEGALKKAEDASSIDEAHVGSVTSIPLPDSSVDICICWAVLCLVDDMKTALSEIARVVKSKGEIIIFDMHSKNPYVKFYADRPKFIERLFHGSVKPPVRAIDEPLILENSPANVQWSPPRFRTMFARHKNFKIRSVHLTAYGLLSAAKFLVGSASWTANYVLLKGNVVK